MAGYITVNVFTARQAIPLYNASVAVLDTDGNLISFEKTNRDGITQSLTLPAPPRENSESPNNGDPFAVYDVRIDYPGYYTTVIDNVQIFDQQTSRQEVGMIPLPENTELDQRLIRNIITPQNL